MARGWKTQIRQYGAISSKTLSSIARDSTKVSDPDRAERKAMEQADICLTCKKPDCKGTYACFKRRRKEQACEKTNGTNSST